MGASGNGNGEAEGAWLRPWSHVSSVPGLNHITWKPVKRAREKALRSRDTVQMPRVAPFLGTKVLETQAPFQTGLQGFKGSLCLPCSP